MVDGKRGLPYSSHRFRRRTRRRVFHLYGSRLRLGSRGQRKVERRAPQRFGMVAVRTPPLFQRWAGRGLRHTMRRAWSVLIVSRFFAPVDRDPHSHGRFGDDSFRRQSYRTFPTVGIISS